MEDRNHEPHQHALQGNHTSSLRLCNRRMLWYLMSIGWSSLSIGYNFSLTLPSSPFFSTAALTSTAIIDLIFYISDVGGIFGALIAGFLCDRYGRRPAILTGTAISLIATGILTASVNLAMFLVFRFFVGVGLGMLLVAIPIWITEMAAPKGRAILNSIHPILIILGSSLPTWIAYASGMGKNNYSGWRVPTGVGCVWPFLCLLFGFSLPESPRWLLRNEKPDSAWKVLISFRSESKNVHQAPARLEFEQIVRQINLERPVDRGYGKLYNHRSCTKRVFIACALNFFVLSSGIFVIRSFDFPFYSTLGHFSVRSYILREGAWNSAIVGMSLLALVLVDRMPRRFFIAIGFLGCHASLIAQTYIAAAYDQLATSSIHGFAIAGITLTYVFGFFYAVFLNGSRFFYATEILPNQLRAKGMALAIVTYCVTDILWTVASSYALPSITWKFFIIFVVLSFLGMGITLRMCPDTRGLPLEEIGRLFGDQDQTTNRWNITQHGDVDQNAWVHPRPMDSYQQPGSHEMSGTYRFPELSGMRDPAEASGHDRYEMSGRAVPAQLGGREVYEFPSGNSR